MPAASSLDEIDAIIAAAELNERYLANGWSIEARMIARVVGFAAGYVRIEREDRGIAGKLTPPSCVWGLARGHGVPGFDHEVWAALCLKSSQRDETMTGTPIPKACAWSRAQAGLEDLSHLWDAADALRQTAGDLLRAVEAHAMISFALRAVADGQRPDPSDLLRSRGRVDALLSQLQDRADFEADQLGELRFGILDYDVGDPDLEARVSRCPRILGRACRVGIGRMGWGGRFNLSLSAAPRAKEGACRRCHTA